MSQCLFTLIPEITFQHVDDDCTCYNYIPQNKKKTPYWTWFRMAKIEHISWVRPSNSETPYILLRRAVKN